MSIYDVTPVSVADYRKRARRRLPAFLFDYLDGAANDENTARYNTDDFSRYRLKQHVMVDVDGIDTSITLSGMRASMPVALAPVGMAGMFRRRGEVQGALAAQSVNIPFTASTVGICSVEEIAAATARPFWFQLYMLRDRELVERLLARASAAGCDTLVFTVDLAVPGMRLRDYRNGMLGGGVPGQVSKLFQLASSPLWAFDVGLKGKPHNFGNLRDVVPNPNDLNAYKRFIDAQFDSTATWGDIHWLRDIWNGKIIIKGVLEADDARAAVDCGADGVVVSNHGGRQLDGTASSISKLACVSAAVGDSCELFLDGGVRSGIDVIKALALGAKAVLLGRPWIYAMAASGDKGIAGLLTVFQQEIATAMALMGVTTLDQINRDHIEERS